MPASPNSRKSLGIIRQLGEAQTTRLNIASAAISNFDPPLLAALDRIDAIFVAMDDMVGDLVTRRAALTTGLEELARRPLSRGAGGEDGTRCCPKIRDDLVVIDDRPARRLAKAAGLNVIGTLGLLLEAKARATLGAKSL